MDKAFVSRLVASQTNVNGLFTNIRPLNGDGGDGHFSVVCQATHIPTTRPVALKFLVDGGSLYRRTCFEREATLLGSDLQGEAEFVQLIEPPGALEFSVDTPAGPMQIRLPYLPFEWMQHGNAGTLARQPPRNYLNFVRTIRYLIQMNRCVQRLHFLECRHRDLKPDNFFLGKGKQVRLGDFGTSRSYAPGASPIMQSYGAPPGDLAYTAVEALAGIDLDCADWAAADIYSLGAIYFELLTGIQFAAYVYGAMRQIHDFMARMGAFNPQDRRGQLHATVRNQDWQIPTLRHFNPDIPRCAVPYLDDMIHEMLRLDYRRRNITSERVNRLLRRSELVVMNEMRSMRRVRRGEKQ